MYRMTAFSPMMVFDVGMPSLDLKRSLDTWPNGTRGDRIPHSLGLGLVSLDVRVEGRRDGSGCQAGA